VIVAGDLGAKEAEAAAYNSHHNFLAECRNPRAHSKSIDTD
jgi:hypothetical protein